MECAIKLDVAEYYGNFYLHLLDINITFYSLGLHKSCVQRDYSTFIPNDVINMLIHHAKTH